MTKSNGKYADVGGEWVTIYQDLLNERQITFSLTDGSNNTNLEPGFGNVTDDVFYTFRVRAINKFGKSDWSEKSRAMNIVEILKRAKEWRISDPPSSVGAMVGGAVTALALLCIILVLYIFILGKGGMYPLKKFIANGASHGTTKIINGVSVENGNAPDMELANLSRPPNPMQENPMYDVPSDEELAKLPKVHRAQITLTRFLGSGAFGEVFEGVMKGNPSMLSYLSNEASPVARAVASHNIGDTSNLNDTRDSPNIHNVQSRNQRGHSPSHLQVEEVDEQKRKHNLRSCWKSTNYKL